MKFPLFAALVPAALLAGPWTGPADTSAHRSEAALHPHRPPCQQAGGPVDEVARLPMSTALDPDWRDSALELLSQIGVLCPAAGCDSLEDD